MSENSGKEEDKDQPDNGSGNSDSGDSQSDNGQSVSVHKDVPRVHHPLSIDIHASELNKPTGFLKRLTNIDIENAVMSELSRRDSIKDIIRVWGIPVLLAFIGFIIAATYIKPAPPKQITIATGSASGEYFAFAKSYAEALAEHGIELKVMETGGSVSNYDLLLDEESNVTLALVQGGTAPPDARKNIEGIASVYQEPLWLFARKDSKINRITDLADKKIGIGTLGSGTMALAQTLLEKHDLFESLDEKSMLYQVGGQASAKNLKAGELDAAFYVISGRSALVRALMADPDIELIEFPNHMAYHYHLPYLKAVTLPEGVIDFSRNLPDRDMRLLAPVACLVCRRDTHPALIPLLVDAVQLVHGQSGIVWEPGEFPTTQYLELLPSEETQYYLQHGKSFLHHWLPFWLASWLDRVKIFIFPIFMLLLPLLKITPPIYRWRIRSRIYRWYKVIHAIDQRVRRCTPEDSLVDELKILEDLERELGHENVPLSYMEEFYHLITHLSHVKRRLYEKMEVQAV